MPPPIPTPRSTTQHIQDGHIYPVMTRGTAAGLQALHENLRAYALSEGSGTYPLNRQEALMIVERLERGD